MDSYDPEELDYSAKCTAELEKSGKWCLVHKERRELHAIPDEEHYRDCQVYCFFVLFLFLLFFFIPCQLTWFDLFGLQRSILVAENFRGWHLVCILLSFRKFWNTGKLGSLTTQK